MNNSKTYRLFKITLLAFLLFNVTVVSASALKGVKDIKIVVESLAEDDAKCGITKGMIDAAVRLPLSNSKINVTERFVGNYLYINVLSVELRGVCSVIARVEFKKNIPSQNDIGAFWDRQSLSVWGISEINTRVANKLEGFTKEFVAEWLKVNSN